MVFCFECGHSLTDNTTLIPGVKPRYHKLVQDTGTSEEQSQPRSIQTVNESRKMRETGDLFDARLTCLRCGTVHEPKTGYCGLCGASLIVSDELNGLRINASARSSVGRVRNNNEDTVGLWARNGAVLALVADGMGGAAAGELASRLAKEAIQANFMGASHGSENLQELSETEIAQKLRLTVDYANEALLKRIHGDNALQGMGTTVTLALLRGNRIMIAHIGDSRAYLVDGKYGWIHQVTDDHSFVEALLASGHITQAQAARHPMRSVLYRALGQSDMLGFADLYARELHAGDRVVLCSDGLPRHINNEEIAAIAMQSDSPEQIAQSLIDLTLDRGAEDNVSVVALVISTSDEVLPLEQLKPIPGEQERDIRAEGEGAFQTGRYSAKEIEQARQAAAQKRQNPADG